MIRNALIEFNLSSIENEAVRENDFLDWSRKNILEVIDNHAVNLTDDESVIQIPELNINLSINIKDKFFDDDDEITSYINTQIKKALQDAVTTNQANRIQFAHHQANTVLDFIQTGQLNRHYDKSKWIDLVGSFLTELSRNPILELKWLRVIHERNAFKRFFEMTNEKELNNILEILLKTNKTSIYLNAIRELFTTNTKYFQPTGEEELYYLVIKSISEGQNSLKQILKEIIRSRLKAEKVSNGDLNIPNEHKHELNELIEEVEIARSVLKIPEDKNDSDDLDLTSDGVNIGQAGLVLLAPFLPLFLERTGYYDKSKKFLKQEGIPILLHYLATGESEVPEWKLTLPKILAGLNPGQHCQTKIEANNDIDEQIDLLLKSVIEQWPQLKNTSPEGLREAFLIRAGLLKSKNGYYYLYVNDKTIDILLSTISWNYSTIRLEWMQDIIFVEWNKS